MNKHDKQVIVIAGLNYGDEGKGTTVDFLVREHEAHTVVRYNGGSQAAHHVVTDEGIVHCFAQFGAGTLVPGTRTYLSKYMLINPINMINEEKALAAYGIADAYERLFIDEEALIITPLHRFMNRIREIGRGTGKHGSCGQGIWETHKSAIDFPDEAIRAKELYRAGRLAAKLDRLRSRVVGEIKAMLPTLEGDGRDEAEEYLRQINYDDFITTVVDDLRMNIDRLQIVPQSKLAELLSEDGTVIFEGAQGVLLDAWRGFFPYVTGTDTTMRNADQLLTECGYDGKVMKLGILRAYMTRHGAGPFVTEDSRLGRLIPDQHNESGRWQGDFRIGWFDMVATKYAISIVGHLDGLVITGLDRLENFETVKVCTGYGLITDLSVYATGVRAEQEQMTGIMENSVPDYKIISIQDGGIDQYAHWLAEQLNVPLAVTSFGPTASDKHFHTPFCSSKAGSFLTYQAPLNEYQNNGILFGC